MLMDSKRKPDGAVKSVKKSRPKGSSSYLAHPVPRQATPMWQPLPEHRAQAAGKAAGYGNAFGAGALAEAGCRLHDVGKYAQAFQDRLRGDPHRVDHATWGARIARERYGPLGTLLAYAIAVITRVWRMVRRAKSKSAAPCANG